jgi:hypothetical protein
MEQYTISRSVRDLAAFVDRLDKGPADVLGFSAGAIVLTRALAAADTAARVHRAIIAEPGPMDGPTALISGQQGRPSARGLAPAPTGPRATRVPRYAVALGLIRLGALPPDTGLITQAEGVNAFKSADLGSDTASAYCARDAGRIPTEDTAENFSFNAAASLRIQQTIKDSPSIVPRLSHSRTPAMLMIAECSSQYANGRPASSPPTPPSSEPNTCPASDTACGTASTTTTSAPPPSSQRSSSASRHPCRTTRPAPASSPSSATTGKARSGQVRRGRAALPG